MGKNAATTFSLSKKWVGSYQMSQLFSDLCHVANTELKFLEAILFKLRAVWIVDSPWKRYICGPKRKQLIGLSHKNKQKRVYVPSYNFKTANKFHF